MCAWWVCRVWAVCRGRSGRCHTRVLCACCVACLQLDTDEVVLRRTIGLKKDEYFINRKRSTKVRHGTCSGPLGVVGGV